MSPDTPWVGAPSAHYQQLLSQGRISADPSQQSALARLDQIYQRVCAGQPSTGLYLWGDVGRGKTLLMDLFHQSFAPGQCQRYHFHRFMLMIHQQLARLSGLKDPLQHLARQLATTTRVLCLDEFYVEDIADAMLLGRLLAALLAQKVVLVSTSNSAIEKLYWDGLQRQRLLPALALLQQQCPPLQLEGTQDYRLHQPTDAAPLISELSACAPLYQRLSQQSPRAEQLLINQRPLPVYGHRPGYCAWFAFDALCNGPRSARDYIELANRYRYILVSSVPRLGGEPRGWIKARGTEDGSSLVSTGERQLSYAPQDDPARRFISLVDELYDRRVQLYLQSEQTLETLYQGSTLALQFRRTYSRLRAMQNTSYHVDSWQGSAP